MKHAKKFLVWTLLNAAILAGFSNDLFAQATTGVVQEKFATRLNKPKEIDFFIRWPGTPRNGVAAPAQPGPVDAAGVLAYCTWKDTPEELYKQMADAYKPEEKEKNPASEMLKFADEHRLIIITWTLGSGFWDRSLSADEMEKDRAKYFDQAFSALAETWEGGLRKLIRKHKLPASNYLLLGNSRGAQWAHRLALRYPDYFKAVSISINSSYDLPTKSGSNIWWHVTTGELETGYPAARRWFANTTKMGYQVVFRGDPNLAHEVSGKSNRMRWDFFRYALNNMAAKRMDDIWVADYINHVVYPAAQANLIPEGVRVWLPTEELAKQYAE